MTASALRFEISCRDLEPRQGELPRLVDTMRGYSGPNGDYRGLLGSYNYGAQAPLGGLVGNIGFNFARAESLTPNRKV